MKALKSMISSLLALALLAVIGAGLYYLLRWVAGYFAGPGPQGTATLAAVVVGVLILGWLLRGARKAGGETPWKIEKARVYQSFLSAWSQMLRGPATERESRVDPELDAAEKALMLWASSTVLRNYAAVRDLRRPPKTPAERRAVERVLRAMRADLGQVTVGLEAGDLTATFLSRGEGATDSRQAEPPGAAPAASDTIGGNVIPAPFSRLRQ